MRRVLGAMLVSGLVAASACGSGGDGTIAAAATTSTAPGTPVGSSGQQVDGVTAPTSTREAPSPDGGSTVAGPSPTSAGGATAADVYAAPAGRYVYDTSGFSETGSGTTRRRTEPPPESVDEVSVTKRGSLIEVRTVTSYGSSGQETTVAVAGSTAHLTRLSYRSTNAGVTTEQAVTPRPEILVARIPYVVGDRWESTWRDSSLGMQGVGWGAVVRRETVSTGTGKVNTIVLQLHQRLEGSLTGELDITTWVNPTTGVVVRQVLITDLQDATGSSHSEITRVLRSA